MAWARNMAQVWHNFTALLKYHVQDLCTVVVAWLMCSLQPAASIITADQQIVAARHMSTTARPLLCSIAQLIKLALMHGCIDSLLSMHATAVALLGYNIWFELSSTLSIQPKLFAYKLALTLSSYSEGVEGVCKPLP